MRAVLLNHPGVLGCNPWGMFVEDFYETVICLWSDEAGVNRTTGHVNTAPDTLPAGFFENAEIQGVG